MADKDAAHSMPDLSVFETEIRKTGFVLESRITRILQKASWSVISNKYYVDDASETVREIDLVAYKVNKCERVQRLYYAAHQLQKKRVQPLGAPCPKGELQGAKRGLVATACLVE